MNPSQNNFWIDDVLIGDGILKEPALTTLGKWMGGAIQVYVRNEALRPLFQRNDWIEVLTDDQCVGLAERERFRQLDCVTAMRWAKDHEMPFAAGYFGQMGLGVYPDDRVHPLVLNVPLPTFERLFSYVVMAPFGRTCSSPMTGKGHKTTTLTWWLDLIRKIRADHDSLRIYSLGAENEPHLPETTNLRGWPLDHVCGLIRYSKLFISVETGILHLSNHLATNVIYLNAATPEFLCAPKVPHLVTYRKPNPSYWNSDDVAALARRFLT